MADYEDAIASVERVIDASAALRKHLVMNEKAGRRIIAALRSGVDPWNAVDASGQSAAALRSSTNDLLHGYEQARHRMRTAFILPSLEGGRSIGYIGRSLGVSRQLASRLASEALGAAAMAVE